MPTWLLSLLGLVQEVPSLVQSVETLVGGIANEFKNGSGQTNPLGVVEAIASAAAPITQALVANTPHAAVAAEVNPAAEADGDKFRQSEVQAGEDTGPGSVA